MYDKCCHALLHDALKAMHATYRGGEGSALLENNGTGRTLCLSKIPAVRGKQEWLVTA